MELFSTMADRLEERSRAFREHLEAAAKARQDEVDVQQAQAQARAGKSRGALDAEVAGARDDFEATLAAIKAAIRDRRDAASGAQADAADAEAYAGHVFDLALSYLDEAEVAALAASFARDRAYVLRHEAEATPGLADRGSSDPAAAPTGSGTSRIGALYDQVVGSAKHDVGKVAGSARLAAEGAAQEAKGHVDWAVGREPPRPA